MQEQPATTVTSLCSSPWRHGRRVCAPFLRWVGDCYVYFDNTAAGHAPTNALTLEHLLDADGWAIGGGAAAS